MTVTSHVLDASTGRPAGGVRVQLEQRGDDSGWAVLASGTTGDDGRLRDWVPDGAVRAGVHRLVFDTGTWFAERGQATFYPEVVVVFDIANSVEHFHVPLILGPFAYSTYRGS